MPILVSSKFTFGHFLHPNNMLNLVTIKIYAIFGGPWRPPVLKHHHAAAANCIYSTLFMHDPSYKGLETDLSVALSPQ